MIYLIYLWCSQLVYATHLADIDWMSPHLLWLAQSLEVSRLEVISHIFRCQLVLSVCSISPCFLHFASRRAWHYSGTTGSIFKTVRGVVSLLPSLSCLSFQTCSLMLIRPDIKQLVNTNSNFKARIWATISILNIQLFSHCKWLRLLWHMCKMRQSVKYLSQNLPDSCTLRADLEISFRKISTMNYIKNQTCFHPLCMLSQP